MEGALLSGPDRRASRGVQGSSAEGSHFSRAAGAFGIAQRISWPKIFLRGRLHLKMIGN